MQVQQTMSSTHANHLHIGGSSYISIIQATSLTILKKVTQKPKDRRNFIHPQVENDKTKKQENIITLPKKGAGEASRKWGGDTESTTP